MDLQVVIGNPQEDFRGNHSKGKASLFSDTYSIDRMQSVSEGKSHPRAQSWESEIGPGHGDVLFFGLSDFIG